MSDPDEIALEEQVGLLKQDEIDRRSSGSESYAEDDSQWKATRTTASQPRRRWIVLSITIIIICITALLSFALTHKANLEPPTSPAQLRPEEDYILSPTWDSDAPPTTREHTWIISDHTLNPDGVHRPMLLINHTFPGPLIQCNQHDHLVIHVANHAQNATSVHWHGLFQNGSNPMDGTVGVTSCPIPPGHSFTYSFNVSAQSGTYYYHSHMGVQASDGLVGPLVIHARNEDVAKKQLIPYEQDRVLMLSDHYYDLSSELLMQYLAPGRENQEPVPSSALMNGRNLRDCQDVGSHRECDVHGLSRAGFDVLETAATRLRVLNVGALAEFSLQIDEHEFWVTEVDGTDVMPLKAYRLNVTPGQRYSVILTPPGDGNKGLYWMRARMITHCFAYENPELQEEVWGVIRYANGSNEEKNTDLVPQTKDWSETIEVECHDLNTTLLSPVVPIAAPETADHIVYLRSSFQNRDWALSRGYLNDSSWRINATKPILHTLLDSFAQTASSPTNGINTALFNPKTQLIHQTTHISTIDILIQNFDDGIHPFHLHGHKFFLLASGHGYAPSNLHTPGFLDTTNPLRRDTASVEAFGWLLIRFVADSPGVWAFHCHVAWHVEAGLGMVFATRTEDMGGWDVGRELCEVEGAERGMGPGDEVWVGALDEEVRDSE